MLSWNDRRGIVNYRLANRSEDDFQNHDFYLTIWETGETQLLDNSQGYTACLGTN